MTKKEYLDSLSGKLGTMSYSDVTEIIIIITIVYIFAK